MADEQTPEQAPEAPEIPGAPTPPAAPEAPAPPGPPPAPGPPSASTDAPAVAVAPQVPPVVPVVSPAMSADTPPAPSASVPPPPVGVHPVDTTPPVPAKKSRLPWIIGGAAAVVLVLIVVAIVVVVNVVGGLNKPKPQAAVLDFDRSYQVADCTLFENSTTAHYRSTYYQNAFDCNTWKTDAAKFTVDGKYLYSVQVLNSSTASDGTTATVTTKEIDSTQGNATEYDYTYTLVPDSDGWAVDDIVQTK